MAHPTKLKGDLGLTHIMLDLVKRGAGVFLPVSDHLKYDLVADFDGKLFRVQCKFRRLTGPYASLLVPSGTTWANSSGTHSVPYQEADFDVMAIWVADREEVLYLPPAYMGLTIAFKPQSTQDYFWHEDFFAFPPVAAQKREKVCTGGRKAARKTIVEGPLPEAQQCAPKAGLPVRRATKIAWPDTETLRGLVASMPTSALALQLGVSDAAIAKRCKKLGIEKPERGYWAKQQSTGELAKLVAAPVC